MAGNDKKISEINIRTALGMPRRAWFGEVSYPPGGTFGPRWKLHLQLVIIHAGEVEIQLDDQPHQLGTGSICLLKPNHREYFHFSKRRPTHHSWADLEYPDYPPDLLSLLDALPFSIRLSDAMRSIIEAGIAARMTGSHADDPALCHLAIAALHQYIGEAHTAHVAGQPSPESIILARRLIETHYPHPLTLDEIADAAHLSANHLIRLFKQHLATTPSRYLWQIRTRRGVDLLRSTGLSVSEIAYRVGFQTPYHFSRLVKQQTGKSPRQLRTLLKESP